MHTYHYITHRCTSQQTHTHIHIYIYIYIYIYMICTNYHVERRTHDCLLFLSYPVCHDDIISHVCVCVCVSVYLIVSTRKVCLSKKRRIFFVNALLNLRLVSSSICPSSLSKLPMPMVFARSRSNRWPLCRTITITITNS